MTHFAGKAGKILVLSAITALLLAVSAAAAEDSVAVAVGATTGSSLRLRAEADAILVGAETIRRDASRSPGNLALKELDES